MLVACSTVFDLCRLQLKALRNNQGPMSALFPLLYKQSEYTLSRTRSIYHALRSEDEKSHYGCALSLKTNARACHYSQQRHLLDKRKRLEERQNDRNPQIPQEKGKVGGKERWGCVVVPHTISTKGLRIERNNNNSLPLQPQSRTSSHGLSLLLPLPQRYFPAADAIQEIHNTPKAGVN